jgi:hypothetical protein
MPTNGAITPGVRAVVREGNGVVESGVGGWRGDRVRELGRGRWRGVVRGMRE